MDISQQLNHPVLIIVRGLPGSGKSYIAEALQKAIVTEATRDITVMLDPDATDYESQEYAAHVEKLTTEGVDPKIHAYRFIRGKAYDGIADNKVIIWNQPFTNLDVFNKMMTNLHIQATEHKVDLPVLVVEVSINPEVAKERIAQRKRAGGHGPSDTTFARFVGDYEGFAQYGYHTISVEGEDDVHKSVDTILQALQDL